MLGAENLQRLGCAGLEQREGSDPSSACENPIYKHALIPDAAQVFRLCLLRAWRGYNQVASASPAATC